MDVGALFSEDHPLILKHNSNLLEVYNQKGEQPEKEKVLLIARKNLEICEKAYGDKSIYSLRCLLQLSSNLIAQLKIGEANSFLVKMKDTVVNFHGQNPYDFHN